MVKINDLKTLSEKDRKVISPGQEISTRMRRFGWDQVDLALILDVSESTASNIVRGRTQINYQLAESLAKVFGETAEYWIMRQLNYNKWLHGKHPDSDEIQQRALLYKLFPVRELMQLKWISPESDVKAIERDLKSILGEELYQHVLIRVGKRETPAYGYIRIRSEVSELLWVRKAMGLISESGLPAYDADRLRSVIEVWHYAYGGNESYLNLIHDLEAAGVVFRILPGFQKTSLAGGLFWANQNPVMVYTQRFNTYPPFQNFVELLLEVCSRFRTGDYKDVSEDGASQNIQIGINPYTSHNGSFRIIDMDYIIGTGLNKPVDLSKLESLVLSPGRDILVFYHQQQSMFRKLKTLPQAELVKLEFPREYYLE